MTRSERCKSDDLFDNEHHRCIGAIYTGWLEEGVPCECACHKLPRCFTPYVANHGTGIYDCDLHEGHGGNFHSHRGRILWSKRV
jgi:hypothetical protein